MLLSVLDQSPIVSGRTPAESIRETLALAAHCDALGYHRYWVSEHHNSPSAAGAAPEILLGALAATTSRIRLGAAGIMLPHYASLKVAEQFRTLEAIAPGRIDLGLGRAPGSDQLTAHALNPHAAHAADAFPAQLRDVMAWVSGAPLVANHPFGAIVANPAGPTQPEVWMLGSSTYGAQVAAYFGLPYCYAWFFADGLGAEEALDAYRASYRPSERHPRPHVALCVFALAAESEAEAHRLIGPRDVWTTERNRGRYVALPSPEEAARYPFTEQERARQLSRRERDPVGTGEQVLRRLSEIATSHAADEIAVVTAAHDAAARRRSYSLLAEANRAVRLAAE